MKIINFHKLLWTWSLFAFYLSLSVVVSHASAELLKTVLSGKVIDFETSQPVAEAQVSLINLENEKEYTVFTDTKGEYTVEGLTKGTYRISSYKESYYGVYHNISITPESSSRVMNFSLAKMKKGRLTGVIYDNNDGTHVSGAKVKVKDFNTAEVLSDKYGTYLIENLPDKAKTILADKEGFVSNEYYLLDLERSKKSFSIELIRLSPPVFIGPEGGNIKKDDGTEVIIPKGALDDVVGISITLIPTKFNQLNENGVPTTVPVTNINFEPEGTIFNKAVTVKSPSLVPLELAPASDTEGEAMIYSEQFDRSEKIKARYHKQDHAISYDLAHFSKKWTHNGNECSFRKKSEGIEKNAEDTFGPACRTKSSDDTCLAATYTSSWTETTSITTTAGINFEAVSLSLSGSVAAGQGNGKSLTTHCGCARCLEETLKVTSKATYKIEAYYCYVGFFSKNYYAYRIFFKDKVVPDCIQGNSCKENNICYESSPPSTCCSWQCKSGKCKPVSISTDDDCKKCNTSSGACENDDSESCDLGASCTTYSCEGGQCVDFYLCNDLCEYCDASGTCTKLNPCPGTLIDLSDPCCP
jgi:hypothetical protein